MKKIISSAFVLAVAMTTLPAGAFIVAGHDTATQHGLQRAGLKKPARNLAQISNYQVDFMTNLPAIELPSWVEAFMSSSLEEDFEKLAADIKKVTMQGVWFHFDRLEDGIMLESELAWLREAAKSVVLAAKKAGDAEMVLNALGIVLHAVQDIYAHSNFVDHNLAPWTGPHVAVIDELPSEIWQSPVLDFYTGDPKGYDNVEALGFAVVHRKPWAVHGDQATVCAPGDTAEKCGLCHDSAQRPRYLKALEYAIRATELWALDFKRWINDDKFWQKVINFDAGFIDGCLEFDMMTAKVKTRWAHVVTPGTGAPNTDQAIKTLFEGLDCSPQWMVYRWPPVLAALHAFVKRAPARAPLALPATSSSDAKPFEGSYEVVAGPTRGTLNLKSKGGAKLQGSIQFQGENPKNVSAILEPGKLSLKWDAGLVTARIVTGKAFAGSYVASAQVAPTGFLATPKK